MNIQNIKNDDFEIVEIEYHGCAYHNEEVPVNHGRCKCHIVQHGTRNTTIDDEKDLERLKGVVTYVSER